MRNRARDAIRRIGGGLAIDGDDDASRKTMDGLLSEMISEGRATVPPEARGAVADRLRAVLGEGAVGVGVGIGKTGDFKA